MGAGGTARTADATGTARVRAVAAPNPQERPFRIALACAVLVHAVLLLGITRSLPRQMGEKSGRPDGISVVLVEAADLRSRNTFATDGGAPGAPVRAQPPPKEAERSLEQQQKPEPQPSPKEAPELAPPTDQAAKQEETRQQKQQAPMWPLDKQALEFVRPPAPAKQSEPAEAPPPSPPPAVKPVPTPPQKPAPPLQLELPDTAFVPSGIAAGFARPAGITRSGENDEFGRGVIRALRKTMPAGGPRPGQVTVRFLLSNDGNLIEVKLARSSGDPALDQSVIFAVKQSSFPFPPPRAPIVDRTFLVTYIYR
jgi:TonB family protein